MDDISFFDSSSYPCRGGIWPDAARREKPHGSTISSTIDDEVPATPAPTEVDPPSLLATGDVDSHVKSSYSEGDSNVEINHPSPPQLPHRATVPPPSRDSSPTPAHSHNHLSSANKHDPPAEDPDLLTRVAPLEVHHPPLRHQRSSGSVKSKKRFLGVRRTSRSPSPSLASHSSSRELSP